MDLVDEFIKSLEFPGTDSVLSESIAPKWTRPAAGWLKINTDGAICAVNATAGVGIIVRNADGEFVSAESRRYTYVSDPFTAEMLAGRVAILMA